MGRATGPLHGDDRLASRHLRDEGPGRAQGRLSERQRDRRDAVRHGAGARMLHRDRAAEERPRAARVAPAAARAALRGRSRRGRPGAPPAAADARAAFGMKPPAPQPAPPGEAAPSPGPAARATLLVEEPSPHVPGAGPQQRRRARRRAAAVRRVEARSALRSRQRSRVTRAVSLGPASEAPAQAPIGRRRRPGRPRAALFVAKPLLGAAAGAVGAALSMGLSCLLVVALLAAGGSQEQPPASSALPEAVEAWRAEATAACQAIFGDAKWVDLVLAMMAQESGGDLDVLCYPGGVKRQDIMQACEGAFGSWIINGGGPHNLTACTPKASIWAGTAELKQNIDMWSGYLGGIEPHEIDKVKLVVQGYNFGAAGWFSWNKLHGYKGYTLERAQAYSDGVMPPGAKGTPSHAELVMRYYTWAAPGASDGGATVARAYQELGKPYLWGAVGPTSYDCSGLVSYCLTGCHERLGTTTTFMGWTRVADPQPGDICVNSHHCGVYIGDGKMIHAPHTGDVVKIGDVHAGMIYVRY